MRVTIIVLLIIFGNNYSISKNADSLANYLPFHKDNRWLYLSDTYFVSYLTEVYSIREKAHSRDSIINDRHYFIDFNRWLRFDREQQKILALIQNKDTTFMDFNLNVGEKFIQARSPFVPGDNIATVISKNVTFLDSTIVSKGFQEINTYMGYVEVLYADKIGEIYYHETEGIMGHMSEYRYLIEAIVHINDSIIIYDDKKAPQIIFVPTDSIMNNNVAFRFQVKHEYSVINLGGNPSNVQRHFIDSVVIFYHYEKDSLIQPDKKMLCTLEDKNSDFYVASLALDQQLLNEGYTLYYRIMAKDKGLFPEYDTEPDSGYFKFRSATDVDEKILILSYHLYQNYPNPFNPSTKIKYTIPCVEDGCIVPVQLKVYDVLGNEVATLVDEYRPAGNYEVEFPNVETGHAPSLPSGIYIYTLRAGDYFSSRKMILLK